jgi:hypothetical protein
VSAVPRSRQWTAAADRHLAQDGVVPISVGYGYSRRYLPGSSTVVSVTSGGNTVCKGNATTTRLDSASARAFLSSFS